MKICGQFKDKFKSWQIKDTGATTWNFNTFFSDAYFELKEDNKLGTKKVWVRCGINKQVKQREKEPPSIQRCRRSQQYGKRGHHQCKHSPTIDGSKSKIK